MLCQHANGASGIMYSSASGVMKAIIKTKTPQHTVWTHSDQGCSHGRYDIFQTLICQLESPAMAASAAFSWQCRQLACACSTAGCPIPIRVNLKAGVSSCCKRPAILSNAANRQ